MSEWLESELRRQLRPVAAPDALWQGIQAAGAPWSRAVMRPLWAVPALGTLLILFTAGLLWGIRQSHGRASDLTQFTGAELQLLSQSAGLSRCPSNDPEGIRKWLKTNAHLDLELPTARAGTVRILGARLVELRGSLIAAVNYQVGADAAVLLVSRRACSGFLLPCNAGDGSGHRVVKPGSAGGKSLLSWNLRDQSYMIAWGGAGDPQAGCLLCHAEARTRL